MITWHICKYSLPCGWCELKKEPCSYNNNVTINDPIITPTPAWATVTTETTTATSENVMDMDSAMQILTKGKKNG